MFLFSTLGMITSAKSFRSKPKRSISAWRISRKSLKSFEISLQFPFSPARLVQTQMYKGNKSFHLLAFHSQVIFLFHYRCKSFLWEKRENNRLFRREFSLCFCGWKIFDISKFSFCYCLFRSTIYCGNGISMFQLEQW